MKKYKQLYKYSDCVITNLHIIQHTRWTCLYSYRYNASHQMEDKKTIWIIFCELFFFKSFCFCSQQPPLPRWNQSVVDEVRSCRWTVGSRQDERVNGRTGIDGVGASCIHRIQEGHNQSPLHPRLFSDVTSDKKEPWVGVKMLHRNQLSHLFLWIWDRFTQVMLMP